MLGSSFSFFQLSVKHLAYWLCRDKEKERQRERQSERRRERWRERRRERGREGERVM
jgi:hypothetical protein